MEPWRDERKPIKRWFQRFSSPERRKGERRQVSGLVAYYWDGGTPIAHSIRDISATGLYMVTEQRWYPGTLVTMTLQRAGTAGADPDRSIVVQGRVVHSGKDGVSFAFVTPQSSRQPRR